MEETAKEHERAVSNLNTWSMLLRSAREAPYMWGARGEKTGSGLREEVGLWALQITHHALKRPARKLSCLQ